MNKKTFLYCVLIIVALILFFRAYSAHAAEFLVITFDNGEELPGDVIEVRPDGAKYGRQERNPAKFVIIRVPGLPYETNRLFQDPVTTGSGKNKTIVTRRSYTVGPIIDLDPYYTGTGNEYQMTVGQWNSTVKKK